MGLDMTRQILLQVIEENHITNAQQLTAFLWNDNSKGIITPYPKGYDESLWEDRIKQIRAFYADVLLKKKYRRKRGTKPHINNLLKSKTRKRYVRRDEYSDFHATTQSETEPSYNRLDLVLKAVDKKRYWLETAQHQSRNF